MLRPVDAQVMLHRMPEVNRVTNNDGSRAENQNQAFAQSLQKAVEQEGKQVVQSNQTEKKDVDKEGAKDKKGGRGRRGTRDGADEKEGDKDGKEQNRGMLDLRV